MKYPVFIFPAMRGIGSATARFECDIVDCLNPEIFVAIIFADNPEI